LPHLTKIIHQPKLLVTLYEVNGQYRQIFLDGRPFPEDPTPGWQGYSVGHWDGDTLVIETRGFRDDIWIDSNGSPMSDAAKMTEKLHRINLGTMELEITIDDPKAYTRPFTVKQTEYLEADTELIEAIRTVHRGEVFLYPAATKLLVDGYLDRSTREEEPHDGLTEREREVLKLVAEGYSGTEIAEQLVISPKTVDTYRERIMQKLGLRHRYELVRYALRKGMLKAE